MVRRSSPTDRGSVHRLLEEAGLPVPRGEETPVQFWVAEDGERIVGCAGSESHGEFALVRSVAVDRRSRGQAWGTRLMEALLRDLESRQRSKEVLLVTIEAAGFFERFGFRSIAKDAVPVPIRESPEFRLHECAPGTWMRRTNAATDQPQL